MDSILPEILKEVTLKIVSDKTCRDALAIFKWSKTKRITSSMLCAGGVAGKGTCLVNKLVKL